ncbi:putative protein kinase RLK-Pelle-RLCK-VI family [Rosa chinensis]|uniref:Protein kinase domain-containing protein n=1 Tax=Rosa chinensis TaxID=74649 RepID=A0A2P6P8V5_ROSCH|nr:putative protein kinase RLK-Pelle-RLCK-VI family [Rosa chinensis]
MPIQLELVAACEIRKGSFKDRQLVAVKRLTTGTRDEKIAGFLSELGIIAHLSEGILHRDIKADNILLTQDFVLHICDFSKVATATMTHHNVFKFRVHLVSLLLNILCMETFDVYSFGVLLLELITGRASLNYLQQSLVIWARPLLNASDLKELFDPYIGIGDNYDSTELDHTVLTSSLCIEQSVIVRP